MPDVLKVCIIGAGHHGLRCHLPALTYYREQHPHRLILAGIMDKDEGRAVTAAKKFGIERAYQDLDQMLEVEKPDACLALTPVAVNARTAVGLMRRGIPALIEKPLGASIEEAVEVVQAAATTNARVMVSMNRRFDPHIQSALAWVGTRKLHYLRATMARHNRREDRFLEDTGVHVVDVIRMIAGDVASWSNHRERVAGNQWTQLHLEFVNGARGLLDFLPTAGINAEVIELFGGDFSVEIRSGERDHSWRAWSEGRLVREEITDPGILEFIANGSYAENEAFIEKVLTHAPLSPTPAEVLPAMEICHFLRGARSEPSGLRSA
jgi:predicted dehydrogenase